MATTTPNFGLYKPDGSADKIGDTLTQLAANFAVIDQMPLPTVSGSNSQLQYFKFANGVLIMWGCIHHGMSKPCVVNWGGGGFASADFTVSWPVPLVDLDTTVIIPTVRTDVNPDIFVHQRQATTSSAVFCYAFHAYEPDRFGQPMNNKDFMVLVLGRWK